jgi:hypothetical protein
VRGRRFAVSASYALIEISNQMLEVSVFDHCDRHFARLALR